MTKQMLLATPSLQAIETENEPSAAFAQAAPADSNSFLHMDVILSNNDDEYLLSFLATQYPDYTFTVYGLDGNDIIVGYIGNDTIYGGQGNDYIDGYTGADTLNGGDGNDTLVTGINSGTSVLVGGWATICSLRGLVTLISMAAMILIP